MRKFLLLFAFCSVVFFPRSSFGQSTQKVEGFDSATFHYNGNRLLATRDYKGVTRGYMTGGWWSPEERKNNILSWRTAVVPEKKTTTFYFVGASAPTPADFSRGPKLKLFVNGKYALTFCIGILRDYSWKEGEYQLRYYSKRVEYPYFADHREFQLHGNSGEYQLTVPASDIQPGSSVEIKVELQDFPRWPNGWFMVKDYHHVLQKPSNTDLENEISILRTDVAKLNEQTQILATQLYSKMLGRDKFENEVIYTDGYRHLHPADLIKLKNGDLLVFSREGTEHLSNDGDVFMLRSKDGGHTWGDKTWVANLKDIDEREGCGIQLKDGTILVGIFYNGLYFPDGNYTVWKPKGKLENHTGHPLLGTYTVTSSDNGKTWSKPNYIDIKGMPVTGLEGPTDAPIEMPDGSILMAVIGYDLNGDKKNVGSIMLKSTDKGNSWKYLSTIASDPDGKLGGFVEPGIVRTKTGRILVALRNHGQDNAIWMTYSDDNGKTWVPVWETEMIGHPTDLLQLKDGRILASYGIRPQHGMPGGVRACYSYDDGKTWDMSKEVQIRNDFMDFDIGYPESIEGADGKIFTAYYFNLFNKYFLGGTFWDPK